MITLFWNPAGLHVSEFLTCESFDCDHFVRNVLSPLRVLPMAAAAHQQNRFILYMDHSPIHKSTLVWKTPSQMSVHLAPHPLYSPDVTPSDFLLFACLKETMLRLEFDSAEDVLHWIRADFERISPAVREGGCESWGNHGEEEIQWEGEKSPE
jgi:transposase